MIKNEYNEFIIASIDYIRLFGKNNYIKLYRKHIIDIDDDNYDIEDVEIPIGGHESLKIHFINNFSSVTSYFCEFLYGDDDSALIKEAHNLLKVLKRAIKIHKLNNDNNILGKTAHNLFKVLKRAIKIHKLNNDN